MNRRKKFFIWISGFAVAFTVMLVMFFPVFGGKSGLNIIQTLLDDNIDINPVADEPGENSTSPAYDYWYAPENSFGIQEMKTVNWSYFKQLFKDHFYKNARYKRYESSDWTDGTEYLTLNRTWNESGFWKVDIILDIPVDLYSVNISFGCDLQVLNYIEREGHEIWLNYTANATETYQVMFNWSDIAQIPNLEISKHRTDGKFWISFKRDNVPAGYYVFDPTFGNTGEATNAPHAFENDMRGMYDIMGATAGTADYIKFFGYGWSDTGEQWAKCALYNYVDHDTDYMGTLVGETEEKYIYYQDRVGVWYQFNFSDPKPSLSASTNYYIVAVGDNDASGSCTINKLSGNDRDVQHENFGFSYPYSFPSPWASETSYASNYEYSIYCSYTESAPSNTAPTLSGEVPANQSTSISVTPDLYVLCLDDDANTMNATWSSNSSGSWHDFATNTSIANNTNITQSNSNFSGYSTRYYWRVNLSDGNGGYINETYYFTTMAEPNTAPTLSGEVPSNQSTSISVTPDLYVLCLDDNANTMNATWSSNSSGSWQDFAVNSTIANNTNITQSNSNFSAYSTRYYWRVNLSDGNGGYINETYYFTTGTDTVTVTLIDYMPANIRTNNTGIAWFLYNITTGGTPINPGSIVWAYGVNHTLSITRNTSYSLEDHLAKNKLRGNNRNENLTIETKFNASAGDGTIGELGEWNVHELGNDVTIVASGSNWTLVNASEPITEHLFNTISFVDNEELALENKTTQTIDIYKRNLVKIEYNMTDTGWYNDGHYKNTSMFIHIYVNETDATRPLDIYYANVTYTTGDVTTSPYCELVGDVTINEAYQFTTENSSYYEKDFIINVTGFVGSVGATSKFSIILQSETSLAKPWYLHYADDNATHVVGGDSHYHDFDNRTIITLTTNDGGSWNANSSTPDAYFNYISLDEEDAAEVKLYANDTSGNSAWSSIHSDIIDITNYAPDPANIIVPNEATNYTVGDTIPINYHWIGDPNLDTCWVNISLWDWTRSVFQSYIVNYSITNVDRMDNNSNFTYNWDTTGVSAGNYTIAINITDGSLWVTHSSDIFYIVAWQVIINTINGTYSNTTQWDVVISTINGTYSNTTIWSTIINTINGSYTNTTAWKQIINTINGTYTNTTAPLVWNIISNIINGTYTNTTTWNQIIDTINGTYSNTTIWSTIIDTINGTYSNATAWKNIDVTINGTYSNATTWKDIITTINGTYSNTSIPISWNNIITTINGTYSNTTQWKDIITTINGTYSNTTAWKTIIVTINGTYSNTTLWKNIITTINGSYTNTTAWKQIINTINGTYTNTTAPLVWNIISNIINGTYTNTTTWNQIIDTINGTYTNTTAWKLIVTTINGTYSNDTITWNNIITTINGTYSNTTIPINLTITNEYPTNLSITVPNDPALFVTINSTNGYKMNISFYYGNYSVLLGTLVNQTNGTYYNSFVNASYNLTTYYWSVRLNDGTNWLNNTFSFETEGGVGGGMPSRYGILGVTGLMASLITIYLFFNNRKNKGGKKYGNTN